MSKISKIEISNFRVYKDQIFEISPNANVILLYGSNGFGKTSFFDSIEWGLTGNILRYNESAKEKNEYDILRNTLSEPKSTSKVKIVFDNEFEIERTVKYQSNKDFNSGDLRCNKSIDDMFVSDEFIGKVNFAENFCFTQFLSQELINRFIREMKDTERYESFKSILGLHRHEKYEVLFKKIIDGVKYTIDSTTLDRNRIINDIETLMAKKNNEIDTDPTIPIRVSKYIANHETLGSEGIINDLTSKYKNISEKMYSIERLEAEKKEKIMQLEMLTPLAFEKYIIECSEINFVIEEISNAENKIKVLNNYQLVKYLKDNLDKFMTIENVNLRLTEIENEIEQNQRIIIEIEKLDSIEVKINFLSLINQELGYITEYQRLIENTDKIKRDLILMKNEYNRISNLKQEFINTTVKYLSSMSNLSECPVCRQTFDIQATMIQLNQELNNVSDSSDQLFIRNINNNEDELVKNENLISILNDKVSKFLLNYSIELRGGLNELKDNLNLLRLNEKFKNEYKKSLNKYGIDVSQVESEFNKFNDLTMNMDMSVEPSKIEDILDVLKSKQNNLILSMSEFKRLLEKHGVINYSDVDNSIGEVKLELDLIINELNILRIDSAEIQYLINYYKNSKLDYDLSNLNEKKFKLEKVLNRHVLLYDQLLKIQNNSRSVLLNEIERILKSDRLPINKLYNYLNPNLNFENLNIRIDSSNPKNNRLVLEAISENGTKINPTYGFSSAQNNVLAVSIFLSVALSQQWSKLDSIFMDDPVQNMDDINITNFVDIVRNIIKNTDKQIFISTHDKRIFDYMCNKFGERCQTFIFSDYGNVI